MSHNETSANTAAPAIERVRHELVRRSLTVASVQALTPHMVRITLNGDELEGFNSPSPDDHIKIFVPDATGELVGRDYTPRRFDAAQNLLTLDFALHEGGVAADWARNAKPGDTLQMGGPKGSTIVTGNGAWWLLIGDEAALPSVGRRLEELDPATCVFTVLAIESAEDELAFETRTNLKTHWVHRSLTKGNNPQPILNALAKLELPSGPGFIWIGAETTVAQTVRTHIVNNLHHPEEWIKASAYWTQK